MNFREFIISVLFALTATIVFRYFFADFFTGSSQQTTMMTMPRAKEQAEPIQIEIDFLDQAPTAEPITTVLETSNAQLHFSSEGAALVKIAYKRMIDGEEQLLEAYQAHGREDRAFLIALADKTPLYYQLTKQETTPDRHELVYTHPFGSKGALTKTISIDRATCRIDVKVSISGIEQDKAARLRLLLPSPLLMQLADDKVRAITNDGNKINIYSDLASVTTTRMWTAPTTIFGADDRYFIHALVADPDNFIFRAYFRLDHPEAITAFLESQPVHFDKSWTMSFYFGPKAVKQIDLVDQRLEKTLDYGWLAPLARLTLSVMNGIHDYVKNYGLAIILLTLLFRLLMFPLTFRSQRSQAKATEFNKKLQYLTQKYKNDPEMLNREREELLRTEMMPGMMGGCLPMLLQLPLFFALNRVLSSSIELYRASFLWIPNLSVRDPYYILPLLTLVVMVWNAPSMGKTGRNALSSWVMGLLLAGVAASLPAGLALFMVTTSFVGILENKLVTRLKRA